jgi:hypothetical protein
VVAELVLARNQWFVVWTIRDEDGASICRASLTVEAE